MSNGRIDGADLLVIDVWVDGIVTQRHKGRRLRWVLIRIDAGQLYPSVPDVTVNVVGQIGGGRQQGYSEEDGKEEVLAKAPTFRSFKSDIELIGSPSDSPSG